MFAPACARLVTGQDASTISPTVNSVETTLVRELKGAQLCSISPDGTHVCVYRFTHLESFLKPWTYDGGNSRQSNDVLQVIELSSGNVIYATQLRSMVVGASFFADGTALYVETMPMVEAEGGRATTLQRAVIDLRTRKLNERLGTLGTQYFALAWPSVLRVDSSLQDSRAHSLVIETLPDYKEITRVPFAVAPEPERSGRPIVTGRGMVYGHDATPVVSTDRRAVVYGAGHSIVCRRTSNLDLLWTRPIESEYAGAWQLDLTPNGSKIAAAIVGGSFAADQNKFYIGVFNGKDGSVAARLPFNGRDGVAISPDGKLVAISQQTRLSNGQVQPSVNIYDVATGHQVGDVAHPIVNISGFGNSGAGSIGSKFTPDGKYLITSGLNDTMIWAIKS